MHNVRLLNCLTRSRYQSPLMSYVKFLIFRELDAAEVE